MKEKMRAAVFHGNGVLSVEQVDIPEITSPNELLVKVDACSICGTDVHILEVPPAGFHVAPGTILGHELTGIVTAVGSAVKHVSIGDRIVAEPNDYCGICRYCLKGLTNHCSHQRSLGVTVNGGFAEYVKIIEPTAHKISHAVAPELAVFAEPLACVVSGCRKLAMQPGESACVIGGGPIALLYVKMLKASGVTPVIVSEPSPIRRNAAMQAGADLTVDPGSQDLKEIVLQATGGVDAVLDIVGSQFPMAIDLVRNAGRILLFGFNTRAVPAVVQHHIVLKEISVLGSWIARNAFPQAVGILEKNILELAPLITHRLPLERICEGIDILRNGKGLEIIIEM